MIDANKTLESSINDARMYFIGTQAELNQDRESHAPLYFAGLEHVLAFPTLFASKLISDDPNILLVAGLTISAVFFSDLMVRAARVGYDVFNRITGNGVGLYPDEVPAGIIGTVREVLDS